MKISLYLILEILFYVFCLPLTVQSSTMKQSIYTNNNPRISSALPLPPPMRSNVPGTWAHDTMIRRVVEDIIPRIIEDNKDELTRPTSPHRSECLLQINDLVSSLRSGKSGYLRGLADKGPDLLVWNKILQGVPETERNWLDAPWMISEFYLYRRIAEAFRFFETGYDMFVKQKVNGLVEAMSSIDEICQRLPTLLAEGAAGDDKLRIALEVAIHTSLWGNKMDLSLWPASKDSSAASGSTSSSAASSVSDENAAGKVSFGEALNVGRRYILDDHTHKAIDMLISNKLLSKGPKKDIGIVVDNAGFEIVSDMLLAHCLLSWGITDKVILHTKAHPTFVSDATTFDCRATISFLEESSSEYTSKIGAALNKWIDEGKLECVEDLFWCHPIAFWDMPSKVEDMVKDCAMTFVKGDANYRRLLGELEWPLETTASDVLNYWPTPVCALRTFKAEIGVGISPENQARAFKSDNKWMVSGRWGVVQVGGIGR